MNGWAIATILYALPVLVGIRQFDDAVEGCKEWMRSEDGEWFPPIAPIMAAIILIFWPVVAVLEAMAPMEKDQ